MNVLHLCNKVPYPGRDGSTLAMEALVRVLLQSGARVTTLAFNTRKHWVENPSYPKEWGEKARLIAIPANTTPTPWGALWAFFNRIPYTVSRFHTRRYQKELVGLLNTPFFDAVVVDGLTQAVYLKELKMSGLPIIYRAHNVEYRIWEHVLQGTPNPLKRRFLQREIESLREFETDIWTWFQENWAITPEDASEMNGWALPCTVGQWPEAEELPSARLFHMGALDWAPNVEGLQWLVQSVWPLVRASLPQAELTIFGRGKRLNEFHIPEQGIHARSAPGPYAVATHKMGISLIPLWSGSGMRIKALDAMANNKAIISTSLGIEGIGFLDGEHGWVADTPESFARAIVQAATDTSERERRARQAHAFARLHFADETWSSALNERLKNLKHFRL
jgi:hypothetical protein